MGEDDARKTWKGLRPDGDCPTLAVSDSDAYARDADTRAAEREVAKWQALFDGSLVNLDAVPQLREGILWDKCDDLEVRVLLRAKGGATINAMLRDLKAPPPEVIRALSRLAARGALRFGPG